MIPQRLELPDIQEAFRTLESRIVALRGGNTNIDLKGQRIINAGKAEGPYDYVTKFELSDEIGQVLLRFDPVERRVGLLNAAKAIRIGAFATRGAAAAHAFEAFFASDQSYVGWVSTGAAWVYVSGYNSVAQSGIAAVVALLGTNDGGYLFNVTDFTHMLRWTGSATEFAPGDSGSAYIQGFPITPTGGTWGICDGTTYTYLKADGTTGSFATPDYSTAAYLKLGTSATIGPTAAGGLTASVSGGTPAGTVSQPTFTGDPVAAASTAATPDLVAADVTGAGVSPVTTATGTVSQPTFAGSALAGHDHGPNTLELRRSQLIGYFRR